MTTSHKDILLIGDTFAINYKEYNKSNKDINSDSIEEEIRQKIGFENNFVKSLRDDFHEEKLANTIVELLNDSANPAVLHLSSILSELGFSFDVIHCSLKHRQQLIALLKTVQYTTIGISTSFTDKDYAQLVINLIKQYAPNSTIILGGMFVVKLFKLENNQKKLMAELESFNADYFIFNEIGEQPLIDILNYEKSGSLSLENVPNIAYRADEAFIINPYKTNNINISESNWSLFPSSAFAFLRTSVSCMFHCKFCDFPVISNRYKAKSKNIIAKEFENVKKSGIKYVRFLDDTFNLPKKHFNDILNLLVSNDYGFEWVAYMRCQNLDENTVCLMKQAGCIGLFLGLESGNNQILMNMNKLATAEEYSQGISYLNKYNIPAYGSFIVGFPGETDETIKDTINFINDSKIKYYRLFTWAYANLSPIAEEKEKYGIEVSEGDGPFSTDVWKHATMTSDEALEKCKLIMKEVNTSIHCTVPFDYTFYLNRNPETSEIFNKCLKQFNQYNV